MLQISYELLGMIWLDLRDALPSSHVMASAVTCAGVRIRMNTTKQRLRDAALHLLHLGCGEGWLLQFMIP